MDIKRDPDDRVRYNAKIPCQRPARLGDPQCRCWSNPPQCAQSAQGAHSSNPAQAASAVAGGARACAKGFQPFEHWLKPEHWAAAMFAGAPLSWQSGACMRVCDQNPRMGHMSLANGGLGIDLPLLVEDPNDPSMLPVYVQHGYCYTCDRFEWVLYSTDKPASPIVWFTCKKL